MPMRKIIAILFLTLFLAGTVVVTSARSILQGTQCVVEADQKIEGSLFVFCAELYIYGEVTGDVMGLAMRTQIYGRVDGSVYLIGGLLDHYGSIGQSLHYAGAVLMIDPAQKQTAPDIASNDPALIVSVEQNIISTSLSLTIAPAALVKGRISHWGYQLVVKGRVNDEVNFSGMTLYISGEVDGTIYASVGDPASESTGLGTLLLLFGIEVEFERQGLMLTEDGTINGQVYYTGPARGILNGKTSLPPAYVPQLSAPNVLEEPNAIGNYLQQVWQEFTTLLFVGAVALVFSPRLFGMSIPLVKQQPASSVTLGMLTFILSFPTFLLILLISMLLMFILALLGLSGIVIVVVIVLTMLIVGGATLFYVLAILIARAMVAMAMGRFFIRRSTDRFRGQRLSFVGLILGTLIVAIISQINILGTVFNGLILFLGLGAMVNALLDVRRQMRTNIHLPDEDVPIYVSINEPEAAYHLKSSEDYEATADDFPDKNGLGDLPAGFDMDFFKDND